MTDRLKGCFVAFERDIREDDAEAIINAIKMYKGVENVEVNIADADDWINRQQVRNEIRDKLLDLFKSLGK